MNIDTLVQTLERSIGSFLEPLIDRIVAEYGRDPFLILIGCLLSLRAKDTTTIHICRALFARARTPHELLALDVHELETIIKQSVYYKNKARVLRSVCEALIERFEGKVPASYDELVSLWGVGPKTANLVMGMAFGVPSMCVDVHVHRISNRLGLIQTKTPEQSEEALKALLPKKWWIAWNKLLVTWGQNICVPVSPKCSSCAIADQCKRVGVTRHR
ncbi:endonuclease III [bacterium]|nr:endonuclease III [bacterium]